MNNLLDFRVWNGSEMVYDVMVGRFGVFYVNPENNGLDPKDSASLTTLNTKYSDNTPVMQFTGVLDMYSNKLYQGDLVQLGDNTTDTIFEGVYEIKWHDAGYFYAYQSNINWYSLSHLDIWLCGNIHANPELISESYDETNP